MVQAQHQAEAASQRGADQALTRGRADRGEPLDVHRHGAGSGARADEDVHAEVLQRGIQHFFDVRKQAMDFVDEEDFALLDIAENTDQIQLLLQDRPGGGLNADPQF